MAEPDDMRVRAALRGVLAWIARPRIAVPLGLVVLYALVGFLVLPALARHYLPALLRDQLGVTATVGDLRFNPFVFRLEASDFALTDRDGGPLFAFDALAVDFESSSVMRRAWTFAELSLHRPRLTLHMASDGSLNLQKVLDALPSSADAESDADPPPLVLDHVTIDDAWVRYTDAGGATPATAEIGPLHLSVQEIATLPEHRGPYTLRMALPGGAEALWEGHVSLHPLASSGTIELDGLRPEALWDFAAPHIALDPPGGALDMRLDYRASLLDEAWQLQVDALRVNLAQVRLQQTDGTTPLLELAKVEFADGHFDLAERRLAFGSVSVADGRIAAGLDAAGDLDWAKLQASQEPVRGTTASAASAPFTVELPKLAIGNVALGIRDASRNAPLHVDVLVQSARAAGELRLGGARPKTRLSGICVRLADLAAQSGTDREPFAAATRVALDGASLDLERRRFQAKKLAIDGLRTAVQRLADGSIRELERISVPDAAVPLPATAAAADWHVRLAQLVIAGLDANYTDHVSEPPVGYSVRGGSVRVDGIDTRSSEPMQVDVSLPVAEGGRLVASGAVAGDGARATLGVSVEGLSLMPLAPLVAASTRLQLESGRLGADAELVYRSVDRGSPDLQIKGSVGVEELHLNEADGGDRLLAWRSLAASGVEFDLAPARLAIRELRLAEPGAKLVINKDRTTNLNEVFGGPPAPADTAAAEAPDTDVPAADAAAAEVSAADPPATDVPLTEAAGQSLAVALDRVRVDNGTVDFADLSLVLPFAARIENFSGVVRGISSAADTRATLALGGRVGEFGEADVDGQLALFDPERFTDIEVSFRNVALQPLSPYTATFAGRTIARGNLDLELEYKVDDGRLVGDNRVVLQDLQLGEKVPSPDAVDLPLDLAVALLADADGRIDLAVPVAGNVDDPQFNYGRLVARALRNAITGVVTAPFRALGSLLGGKGDEAPSSIRFKSGTADLMPRERERIAQIVGVLAERPQLGIAVVPGIEPERDGYAVRRLAVRRAHAAELGFELQPGEDPGPVSYSEPDSQRALEILLEARDGEGAADRFAADWSVRNAGMEPERVNRALALVDRGAGDAAFYRELYLDLVRGLPEPAQDLQALGQARAEAVVADLLARGLDTARVSIATPRPLPQAQPTGVLLPLDLIAVTQGGSSEGGRSKSGPSKAAKARAARQGE